MMVKKASKKTSGKASKKTSGKASKKQRKGSKKAPRKSEVETAAAKISRAEAQLRQLRKLDAETKDMVKKLSDAKFHFKNKDYKKSTSLCNKAMRIGQLSKRRKGARSIISDLEASREELSKADYDMSEPCEILNAAEIALHDSNFKALRSLLSDAKKSMNLAKQTRKVQETLRKTKILVDDLKKKGSVTLESEILLSEAEEAIRLKDLKKAKDFVKAVRKWIDIEILEKERHELLLAQDEKEVSERLTNLSPQIGEYEKLGIDTSWMEECISDATEAIEGGDLVRAKKHVLELEEAIRSLRGSSIRAARDTIDVAWGRIEDARRQNVGVLVAERSLKQAERAFLRGEYKDSIDFSYLAITFVKRSLSRISAKKADGRSDEDYTQALINIGKMVSKEVEAPKSAPEPSPEGEKVVDDSILELESTYLTLRAQEDLESIRDVIEDAESEEEGLNEAKIMLRKAHDAFKLENYSAVTVLERTVRDLLSENKSKKTTSTA
ncbi:MAG: hypothetical protein ACE5IJ_06885 [Thermoplasmata archaeon]